MRLILANLATLAVLARCACAQAKSRAVPFVGCAADGQQGYVARPRGEQKVVDSSIPSLEGIAYYKSDEAPGLFAPAGWHCFVWYGSSGSTILVSSAPIDTAPTSYAHVMGPAVELRAEFGGTSGRFGVARYGARLFPTVLAGFIARVKSEFIMPDSELDPRQCAHDSIVSLSRTEVEFTTPPRSRGLGTAESLGPSPDPIKGIAVLTGDSAEPDLIMLRVRMGATKQQLEAAVLQLNRRCIEAGETCWGPW